MRGMTKSQTLTKEVPFVYAKEIACVKKKTLPLKRLQTKGSDTREKKKKITAMVFYNKCLISLSFKRTSSGRPSDGGIN